MWGSIIGAAIGGAASLIGGSAQNKANQRVAAEQMAFQERMSGSAYQRAVKDMKLAGINPMLAYSKGGATTPGGAGLPMGNPIGAAGGKIASSALALRRTNAETSQIEADTRLKLQQDRTEINKQVHINQQTHLAYSQRKIYEQNLVTAKAHAQGARTEMRIDQSDYGQFLRWMGRLNPFSSSALNVRRLGK